MTQRILVPPFPELVWSTDYETWIGEVTLPGWTRFADWKDMTERSNGTFTLHVVDIDEEREPPSPEQIAAFVYLQTHQQQMAKAILQSTFAEYLCSRGDYLDYFNLEEIDERLPEVNSPEELERVIGPISIFIRGTSLDGIAYVGVAISCTWDDEHSLGIMLHKCRMVEFGGRDTAFVDPDE